MLYQAVILLLSGSISLNLISLAWTRDSGAIATPLHFLRSFSLLDRPHYRRQTLPSATLRVTIKNFLYENPTAVQHGNRTRDHMIDSRLRQPL